MDETRQLWNCCTTSLRDQVSEPTWQVWFSTIEPLSYEGGVLTLGVKNPVVRERLRSRFLSLLSDTVTAEAGRPVAIDLVVTEGDPGVPYPAAVPIGGDTERVAAARASHPSTGLATDGPPDHHELDRTAGAGRDPALVGAGAGRTSGGRAHPYQQPRSVSRRGEAASVTLDPRFTFDSFVAASSNLMAHAAAQAVAENPGRSYNPLFIYGDSGLGKTHLLHAIGNYVQDNFPMRTTLYVTTETFMNDFVDSLRMGAGGAFKRRYRDCDVLLIDDVQFMENKEGLQEEFFHTYNDLHGASKQIVLTSDRAPKSIETLEDRLRSRFLSGLITEINPPDLETRLAILRTKAEADHKGVPDDVLEFIATNVTKNIRELEGALTQVTAFARLNQELVSLQLAERVLADIVSGNEPRQITPQMIIDATAHAYGFTVEAICGPSRTRPLVTARQVAMYLIRNLTDYSYPAIARVFGGRDHTTVIHAVEKISTQMGERRQIYEQVTALLTQIKQTT